MSNDGTEQFAGLVAEPLHVTSAGLVAACLHSGLQLLASQAAVAGHHSGGHRLDREVEVLASADSMRPQAGTFVPFQ
jgi:hypothetical protein